MSKLLEPIEHFLEWLCSDYGLYLYFTFMMLVLHLLFLFHDLSALFWGMLGLTWILATPFMVMIYYCLQENKGYLVQHYAKHSIEHEAIILSFCYLNDEIKHHVKARLNRFKSNYFENFDEFKEAVLKKERQSHYHYWASMMILGISLLLHCAIFSYLWYECVDNYFIGLGLIFIQALFLMYLYTLLTRMEYFLYMNLLYHPPKKSLAFTFINAQGEKTQSLHSIALLKREWKALLKEYPELLLRMGKDYDVDDELKWVEPNLVIHEIILVWYGLMQGNFKE